MDVLSILREEDDNPRGRGVAAPASGKRHGTDASSLDAAAAEEDRKQAAKASKLPLREQEVWYARGRGSRVRNVLGECLRAVRPTGRVAARTTQTRSLDPRRRASCT